MTPYQALLVGGIVVTSFLLGRVSQKLKSMKAEGLQPFDLR
jgi:hypothetical protein